MIELYFGNNNYESLKALDKYTAKSYIIIDGETLDSVDTILNSLDNFSLFNESQTIIVKRFWKNSKKVTLHKNLLNWLYKQDISKINLIFWEDSEIANKKRKAATKAKKAKTTSLSKFIEENGKINKFDELSWDSLLKWTKSLTEELKIKASNEILKSILERLGNNQFIIESEFKKVSIYLKSIVKNELTHDELGQFTFYEPDHTVWDLTSAIGQKNKIKAIELSDQLLKNPYDFPIVFGATLKNLTQLFFIKKFPYESSKLAKNLSIGPYNSYAIKKIAEKFTESYLLTSINKLINLDYFVKNGLIDVRLGFTLFITLL